MAAVTALPRPCHSLLLAIDVGLENWLNAIYVPKLQPVIEFVRQVETPDHTKDVMDLEET